MPGTFVSAIVTAVIALLLGMGWTASARMAEDSVDAEDARPWLKGFTIGFAALTALLVLVSSLNPVSTRNIGVETAFGRPVGHLSNGLHFTAPWVQVTEMDGAIQTDSYTGSACLDVRIGNQQTACVDVSIRWRMLPQAADELFRNYHDFTNVRDSLVTRELHQAINQQMGGYNPLDVLTAAAGAHSPVLSLAGYASRVQAQMRQEIGSQIAVLSIFIPIMHFDDATQARINQLQQQIAATKIAQQAEQTAKAQSAANKDLASSVSNDPNVLVSRCLDYMNEMIKAGMTPPIGMCDLFGSATSGVIANTGK